VAIKTTGGRSAIGLEQKEGVIRELLPVLKSIKASGLYVDVVKRGKAPVE